MAEPKSISVRFSYRKRLLPAIDELLAEAQRIYEYNDALGGLVWKSHKNPKRPWPPLGTLVGGDDGNGYRMCLVLGHKFKVHQVVWLLCTGSLPESSVDHVDRDRQNNRFTNLRLCTDLENIQNISTSLDQLAGSKLNVRGKYSAVVQYKGKKHYFGHTHKTREDAHKAYLIGKALLCGEFAPTLATQPTGQKD